MMIVMIKRLLLQRLSRLQTKLIPVMFLVRNLSYHYWQSEESYLYILFFSVKYFFFLPECSNGEIPGSSDLEDSTSITSQCNLAEVICLIALVEK